MRSISPEQFQDWSRRLQRSDREAFAALFQATHEALLRYAWYFTKDEDVAYDLLQDVYLKLWQVRETVDPQRSLKALMYQMVRNHALNHERAKRLHATDSLDDSPYEPDTEATTEQDLDAKQLDERLQHWIAEMPERRREAFALSRYEGLSHEEIARIMGLTPKTVNNHIVLALQHLRARLREYEPDRISS